MLKEKEKKSRVVFKELDLVRSWSLVSNWLVAFANANALLGQLLELLAIYPFGS